MSGEKSEETDLQDEASKKVPQEPVPVSYGEPSWKSDPDPLAGFPEDCSQYPGSGLLYRSSRK